MWVIYIVSREKYQTMKIEDKEKKDHSIDTSCGTACTPTVLAFGDVYIRTPVGRERTDFSL